MQRFRAVKLRVGFGREADRHALCVARRRVGEEVELFADANRAWTLPEALEMAPVFRDAGVAWVEEPLRVGHPAELERFVEETGLAVACGENSYGRAGFLELLSSSARLLLQPDLTKTGGFSEVLPICRMAEGCGLDVAPHFYGNAVGWLATLQLGAACPGVTSVELDIRPNPLRDGLLADPPKLTDGMVEVPTGPGLGAPLDEERMVALVQPGTEVVVR
jgi:L-alanine-DL-glutamate epimerase-like enolase superfamily enzyme